MSGLIKRDDLAEAVRKSLLDNPHKDGKVAANHSTEHQHFLHMISKQPDGVDIQKYEAAVDQLISDLFTGYEWHLGGCILKCESDYCADCIAGKLKRMFREAVCVDE